MDTTDGVRVVETDGRWVMVLPDPAEAVTHLWAEGPDDRLRAGPARRVVGGRGQRGSVSGRRGRKTSGTRACRTSVPNGACPARR
ncbi:hypothetical protein GCM10023238_24790 [Streptomyces heliomycini]